MGQTLRIVTPVTITDAMLDTTDVPETDYSEWASGTTYATGDRVIVAADHLIYESLADANTGNTPASSPTQWIEVSRTNRWKLFDHRSTTRTVQATSMSYTLEPAQRCSVVAAIGTVADTVRVRMVDAADGTVYDETITLASIIPESSWYSYFFDEAEPTANAVFTDIPAYAASQIIVDFATASGDVECASLIVGPQNSYGLGVLYGLDIGIIDYSRRETNDFGDVELVQRAYARRASFEVVLRTGELQPVIRKLAELRATPAVWIVDEAVDPLTIYGWFRDFNVSIQYADYSHLTLDVEGLT